MSLFHAALQPALDSNGDPISGATWNFYTTETTTPANVFADAAFNTSLGSVVTANAAGRFATIFLDDSVTYRAILKDAGGATIDDIDPVNPGGSVDVSTSDYISVTDEAYGAVGDGIVDDTAAIAAALAAGKAVFFPAGTYVTSNLTAQFDGQMLFGVGPASRLQFKAGATGYHFSSNGHETTLRDLDFYGGNDGGKAAVVVAASTRSGLKLDYDIACRATGVTVHGYDNVGIGPANTASSVAGLSSFVDCNIYCCWQGVSAVYAEYTRWLGISITGCRQGFYLGSGNVTLSGSLIEYNYDNLYIEGAGDGNNSHGGVTNCRLNHATHFAVYGNALTNGHSFVANDIFYGQISLTDCEGLRFICNTISVSAIGISGGGRNVFRDNYVIVDPGLDNTVTQIGGNTVFQDNFETDGNPIWNNAAPIFGQETFTSGDQLLMQLRESGATVTSGLIDYGFLITSDGGTGVAKFKRRSAGTTSANAIMAWDRANDKIGFLGAAPAAQQSVAAVATDLATTTALANSLRTALINLGLAA